MKVFSANSDAEKTDPGLRMSRTGVGEEESVEGGWREMLKLWAMQS